MRLSVVAVALLLCVSVQFLCVESRSAEDLLMTVISSYGPRLDAGYGYHNWRPKAFFPNDMGHSEKVGRAVEILPESERHLTKFQQALYFVAAHAHDVGYDEAAVANGYTVPAALKSDYDTLQSYQIANKASVEHEEFSMCAYLRALVVLANDGSSDIPQAEKDEWLNIKNIFAGINTIISTKLFVPPAQRHARLRKFLGLPAHSNSYYPHLPAFAAFKHCEALDQLKAYHHAAHPAFDAVMTDLVDRFYPLPLTTTPPVKEGAPPTYTFPPPPSDLHYMVTLAKAIEAGDFASMVSKGSICSMEGLLHEFMGPSAGGMAKNQNPTVYAPLMEEYVTEIQALHSHTPKHSAIQLEKHLDLMKSPWKMINTFWQSQEGFVNLVTGPSSENWKIMQHYPDAAKNKAALLPQLAVMIHLTAIAYKNAYGTDPVISPASAALISAHQADFATLFPKYNAVKAALEEMHAVEKRLSNTHQLDLIMSVNDCFTLQQIPPAGVAQNLPNVWRQIYTYKPTAHLGGAHAAAHLPDGHPPSPRGSLPPVRPPPGRSTSLPPNTNGLGLSGGLTGRAAVLHKKGPHE